ncbi:MAG: hypothetical protein IT384_14860 [Deltaproteobacteria bacterium]|nr:hypothetical protein [Deltaproteobacteria bacterium]
MTWRSLGCAALVLALFTRSAEAEAEAEPASLRFALVFEESVDGVEQKASVAEGALLELLLARGFVFVDEAQSRKIRSVARARDLIDGAPPISGVITSLDADRILAGVVRVSRLRSDLLGEQVARFDAQVRAKLIAVDTARVLGAFSASGRGMGFTPAQAIDRAAAGAAEELTRKIADALAIAAQRATIELSVWGLPTVAAGERLARELEQLRGVEAVNVLSADRGVTKFALGTTLKVRALALSIEGLGLLVHGRSDSAIHAEHLAGRELGLVLAPGTIRVEAGLERMPWYAGAARDIAGAMLLGRGVVSEDRAGTARAGSRLQLEGRLTPSAAPEQLRLELLLRHQETGEKIATDARDCEGARFSACAQKAGLALADGLERWARASHPELAPAAPSPETTAPLRVASLEVRELFPAQIAGSAETSIGRAVLENRGRSALHDVAVTVDLSSLGAPPSTVPVGSIAPRKTRDVPLTILLDPRTLLAREENTPIVVGVEVSYREGERRWSEQRRVPVVVYDKNGMSWSDPQAISSFIGVRDERILRVGREIQGLLSEDQRDHPLALPAAILLALDRRGLRYVEDPRSPFRAAAIDYVQYPVETLVAGAGDCDDLAVLYAAIAESIGLPMLLLATPQHVLVAVATGLPAQSAHLVSARAERLFVHQGQLWIPVETTAIQKSFEEAWVAGAAEVARWRDTPSRLQVVDLRAAWKKYPPVEPPLEGAVAAQPEVAEVERRLAAELERLEAERRAALLGALNEVDGALTRVSAVEARASAADARASAADARAPAAEARAPAAEAPAALRLERAVLLAKLGREEDARAALTELVRERPSPAALNDLGNLELAAGKAQDAQRLYRRALTSAAKAEQVPIRVNAALAAWVRGDRREFSKQIVGCLEAGGEDAVLALARAGHGGSMGGRGAEAGPGLVLRDLAVAIGGLLEARGRRLEDLKGAALATQAPVSRWLYWVSTEARR